MCHAEEDEAQHKHNPSTARSSDLRWNLSAAAGLERFFTAAHPVWFGFPGPYRNLAPRNTANAGVLACGSNRVRIATFVAGGEKNLKRAVWPAPAG
jgi:hypothetical protein